MQSSAVPGLQVSGNRVYRDLGDYFRFARHPPRTRGWMQVSLHQVSPGFAEPVYLFRPCQRRTMCA
jgi:hypothetical protein